MAVFTLTITARTGMMGETPNGERSHVAWLLRQAAERIHSGSSPQGGQNIAEPGNVNASNCTYSFGAGSLNQGL